MVRAYLPLRPKRPLHHCEEGKSGSVLGAGSDRRTGPDADELPPPDARLQAGKEREVSRLIRSLGGVHVERELFRREGTFHTRLGRCPYGLYPRRRPWGGSRWCRAVLGDEMSSFGPVSLSTRPSQGTATSTATSTRGKSHRTAPTPPTPSSGG